MGRARGPHPLGAGEALSERPARDRAASPCDMCNAPQHILEPILLERARELGADIRLHHEVLSVKQDDEQVTAGSEGESKTGGGRRHPPCLIC